jgi:hypothetical protein
MKKLLKNGHHGVIAQFVSLVVQTYIPFILLDLKNVNNNNFRVLGEIPKVLSLIQYHDHDIYLQILIVPTNIMPYKYPIYAQKSEIEHMVQEMLEVGIVIPDS